MMMADASFDILFSGELTGQASVDEVRLNLQQRFNLSEAQTAQLFSGETVTLKRGVDTETASRYRKLFRDAGALIQVRPLDAPTENASPVASGLETGWTTEGAQEQAPAAPDSLQQPSSDSSEIDSSALSLVSGSDWTLEDCEPEQSGVQLPETGHLSLAPPERENEHEQPAS